MKKILIALISVVLILDMANAQENTNVSANLGYTKTSAFIQYGYGPINSFDFWANNTFSKYHPGTTHLITNEKLSSFGSITIGATFSLSNLIELSLPLTYSQGSGTYSYTTTTTTPETLTQDYDDKWYSFTPNVKFNWYHSASGKFMLYSRVGIGASLANRKIKSDHGVDLDSKISFAFMASPIGMEIGKNIAFFAEAGFGQTGIINAGVRFRFRKTKKGYNDDGTAKQYNWTDRYIDRK